ncbi:MAG: YdeI/OmpD-associated family protein [Ginsengibacter sp.]
MIQYKTTIRKFDEQGEKTGWSYIEVPQTEADKLKTGFRKSYRVKGFLDNCRIEKTSLLPMGEGNFIIPLNAAMRKALGKRKGATGVIKLETDDRPLEINPAFLQCLADEPVALEYFNSLPGSHRNYFSKWIESARSENTKANRIARAVNALSKKWGYPQMIRAGKADKLF